MGNYFILDCHPPIEAEHFSLTVDDIGNDKRWEAGLLFSLKDHREGFHPPKEVILLETDDENDDDEDYIYPVLKWVPIPLMSRALVDALIAAGVDNLQTYETHLVKPQGDNPPAEDHYLEFVRKFGHAFSA